LTTGLVSRNLPFVATYQSTRSPGIALEALADPTRRTIFELLGAGPRSVGEIAGSVPVSRPAVSQHLKVLKAAHLVSARSAGTRNIYFIDPAGVRAARDYFDQFWTTALSAYAEVANATEEAQ
jgi:DNA-binding transcriptional ArsR family regulator